MQTPAGQSWAKHMPEALGTGMRQAATLTSLCMMPWACRWASPRAAPRQMSSRPVSQVRAAGPASRAYSEPLQDSAGQCQLTELTQHEAGKQCPFTKQREGRQRLVAPFTIVLSSQQKERNSCLLIGCIRDLPYNTQHGLLRAGALRCLFKWSPPLLQPLFGMEGS